MYIIGAGQKNDKARIPLATREGSDIPNERRLERSPQALNAAVELWKRQFPYITPRSITAVYNCMGLIFASRRTWIDPDHLYSILDDDDYHMLEGPHEIEPGDIIVYKMEWAGTVSHVAVVMYIENDIITASKKITVMSQWGGDGEYLHRMEDIPQNFLGAPKEFWTDRRN